MIRQDYVFNPEVFKGTFLTTPAQIKIKLAHIKAFVFDWDGVFNKGDKSADGSSPFNEVDAMGTTMMRFNHYLERDVAPVTAIITGEKNAASFMFAKREYFNAVYYGMKSKPEPLHHLCEEHNIHPDEVAYFFDDVVDLAVAELCGLRLMMGRACNPMMNALVAQNNLADYVTHAGGGHNGIREAMEMLIGVTGRYNETIAQRTYYTDTFKQFIQERNKAKTMFYTLVDGNITEQPPQ